MSELRECLRACMGVRVCTCPHMSFFVFVCTFLYMSARYIRGKMLQQQFNMYVVATMNDCNINAEKEVSNNSNTWLVIMFLLKQDGNRY